MQWVGYAEMAAAVSEAGGLGIVRWTPCSDRDDGSTAADDSDFMSIAYQLDPTNTRGSPKGDRKDSQNDAKAFRRESYSIADHLTATVRRVRSSDH